MFFYLILLFTLVPVGELVLLLRVGEHIGVGSTVFLVVFTGVIGAALAKMQGLLTMRRMQENLGLSDEQVTQMREIRENGGGREDIRAILTDEQLATMKERRGQNKGKGHRSGQGRPQGEPVEVPSEEIDDLN